jgi:AbrB family looped-hinge helix DNA binding protein
MAVTVSVKGQMVIPSRMRKKYGIKPRSRLELIDLGNEIVVIPVMDDSLIKSRGILKNVSTKDLLKARRQERRREYEREK